MKTNKGITLVALVITIIILLILAGISIQALTQTNLFNQAKCAKNATENSQKEENKILSEYIDEMNKYLPETLVYKVNSGEIPIGSYIKYTSDTASEETINKLIEELGTYSGSEANTKETLKQEMELNWRVLDVKDGQVRLISAEPTSSKIELYGYNGYNNAVKLIDGACSTLYNNSKLASKVQNLKIEDITRYMTTQPTDDKSEYTLADINYPNILKQEKNQTTKESATPKLGISEQYDLVTGNSKSDTILKNTYWKQSMNADTSLKEKYYELFIKKQENYYSEYLISSRCITSSSYSAGFCIRYISSNDVTAFGLCYSSNKEYSISGALRPIITLNSNVQLDTTKAADGTHTSTAYEIK